ncbi:hypothetical protein HGRIS_007603 [Hohenbuehelia grisea]
MARNDEINAYTGSDEDTQASQLLAVSKTVLMQAVELVDNHLISDDQLTAASQYIPGSTIGKHLRHARDHFTLLLDSVSSPPPHILSYDVRKRNCEMEKSRQAAHDELLDAIRRLEDIVPRVSFDEPLTLNAVTPHLQTFQTTFGRELWFGALHCVHHWSMVRVVAGEMGIKLADDFGFAPSTLVYQDKEAPLGKAKY